MQHYTRLYAMLVYIFPVSPCSQLLPIRAVSSTLKNEVMVWGLMHWKTLHHILSKICGLFDGHWYFLGRHIEGCALGTEHPKETLSILNDKVKLKDFAPRIAFVAVQKIWKSADVKFSLAQQPISLKFAWSSDSAASQTLHYKPKQPTGSVNKHFVIYNFKLRICIIQHASKSWLWISFKWSTPWWWKFVLWQ